MSVEVYVDGDDEPPNRIIGCLWRLVILIFLCRGVSNIGRFSSVEAAETLQTSTLIPVSTFYLSNVKLLHYIYDKKLLTSEAINTEDIIHVDKEEITFAFIEIELTKSVELSLEEVMLGFSTSQCDSELFLAQTSLNLTNPVILKDRTLDTEVVIVSTVIPVARLISLNVRTLDLCIKSRYITWEEVEVVTPWRLQMVKLSLADLDSSQSELSHQNFPDNGDGKLLERQRRAEDEGDANIPPRVFAMLLENTSSKKSYTGDGIIEVSEKNPFELLLVGQNLDHVGSIKFTTHNNTYGGKCRGEEAHFQSGIFSDIISGPHSGLLTVTIAQGLDYHSDDRNYYLCVQDSTSGEFQHQGPDQTLRILTTKPFLPVWATIILLVILLCMSGLFSGLNLGLMSLDQTELKIVVSTGSDLEKEYAKAIMPIRGMGNFLLCSILLGNVLVNNTLTVLLDAVTGGGGLVAIIGSTLGIVVFGEIIPQALCSRHGLAVGARTIWLTKFFMLLTSPLSFPISKVLDCVLGSEIGTVYNKERLMELLKVTDEFNDLNKDEVNIVTGALVLKQKTVKDIMTFLDDCYMLPIDSVLDFETISEIKDQGYSRIPIYHEEKHNIVHILFAKDLLFIDPDDAKPIKEICSFYKNDVNFVYQDTILTDMFDEFKSGEKGHMALVQEVNNEGEGDPYYETVGLVTLEDIIEEIIQQEIIDETDIVIDNKSKKKRKRDRYKKDAEFKMFLGGKMHQRVTISPQMSLAVLQFLTTTVKTFSPENFSRRILHKMLSMDVYREMKISQRKDPGNVRYEKDDEIKGLIMVKGKPCDFFIMIIEGRVEITIGKEERKFTEGPFSCFGEQMLEQTLMMPSSPMVSNSQRGTPLSQSMHNSVSQEANGQARIGSIANLKKTNTQNQLMENKRSYSADTGVPLPNNIGKHHTWIPDYSVRAITDVLYLKVRRATYTVAIKASRMNNMNDESGGLKMNDEDINDVLAKVIENDNDEFGRTPSMRSPDKYWDGGVGLSSAGTPTDFRRDSIRSSLSMMKTKLMGGQFPGQRASNTSIDKTSNKDDSWDAGSNNPAMESETMTEKEAVYQNNGPMSLPVNRSPGNMRGPLKRDISDPVRGTALPEIETSVAGRRGDDERSMIGSNNTTVISVQGGNTGSPSDRTSLLNIDFPVSY